MSSRQQTTSAARPRRPLALAVLACALAAPLANVAAADGKGAAMERVQVREYDLKLKLVREAYHAKDWDRAFRLSSETARWGDKWSQFVLGSMYLDGLGGAEENVLLSYGWLAAAAESDIPEFVGAAQKLYAAIPEEHKDKADQVAAVFTRRYGLDATGVTCEKRRVTGSNRRVLDCRKSRSMSDEFILVPAWDGDSASADRSSLAYGERKSD